MSFITSDFLTDKKKVSRLINQQKEQEISLSRKQDKINVAQDKVTQLNKKYQCFRVPIKINNQIFNAIAYVSYKYYTDVDNLGYYHLYSIEIPRFYESLIPSIDVKQIILNDFEGTYGDECWFIEVFDIEGYDNIKKIVIHCGSEANQTNYNTFDTYQPIINFNHPQKEM